MQKCWFHSNSSSRPTQDIHIQWQRSLLQNDDLWNRKSFKWWKMNKWNRIAGNAAWFHIWKMSFHITNHHYPIRWSLAFNISSKLNLKLTKVDWTWKKKTSKIAVKIDCVACFMAVVLLTSSGLCLAWLNIELYLVPLSNTLTSSKTTDDSFHW